MAYRILVVDDDPSIRDMLGQFLKSRGFSVVEAVDGLNAVTVAKQFLPDLMILDFRLPAGDGLKVLERLQKDRNLTAMPVIFMSAAVEEVRAALPENPLVRFIAKPFDVKAVETMIRELLAQAISAKPTSPSPPPSA